MKSCLVYSWVFFLLLVVKTSDEMCRRTLWEFLLSMSERYPWVEMQQLYHNLVSSILHT